MEEWFVGQIIDQRKRGRGLQYLDRWRGEGLEGDLWSLRQELEDFEAPTNGRHPIQNPNPNESPPPLHF